MLSTGCHRSHVRMNELAHPEVEARKQLEVAADARDRCLHRGMLLSRTRLQERLDELDQPLSWSEDLERDALEYERQRAEQAAAEQAAGIDDGERAEPVIEDASGDEPGDGTDNGESSPLEPSAGAPEEEVGHAGVEPVEAAAQADERESCAALLARHRRLRQKYRRAGRRGDFTLHGYGVHLHEPAPGRTRVTVFGSEEQPALELFPERPAADYLFYPALSRYHRLVDLAATLQLGRTFAPSGEFTEMDFGILAGWRFWRRPGGGMRPDIDHSLAAFATVRGSLQPASAVNDGLGESLLLRLGLGVRYQRVTTVQPTRNNAVIVGPRQTARLAIGGFLGPRTGVELELGTQPSNWLGFYGRLGYQTQPERGRVYTAGVELAPGPAIYAYLGPIAIGLLVGLGYAIREAAIQEEEM